MSDFISEIWSKRLVDKFLNDSVFSRFAPKIIPRTWKQRLFSWPWEPWRSYKVIWPDLNRKLDCKDKVIIGG